MSPVYLNQPPSSPIPFLEFKGDQLLGHIHDLATSSSSSSLSYPNLDKNHTYDESLAIEYSRHPQEIKVDGSGYTTYGYSSNHYDGNKNMEIVANNNINNDQKYSRKWKASKVRIMQKMMATSKNNMGEQQGSNLSRNNNNDSNNGVIIRVCSDCHTTTTPLWRSGPRGPKSLCNACGIRQRKARRAAMAAAAAAGFTNDESIAALTVVEAQKPKAHQDDDDIRDHQRSGFDNKSHPLPLKKRGKIMDVARKNNNNYGNSYNNNGLLSSSKDYITTTSTSQRVFPRDEEEGAILLMALSCGLACSS